MGVEPTQDRSTAPQTVLKTAVVTGPRVAPRSPIFPLHGADVIHLSQGVSLLLDPAHHAFADSGDDFGIAAKLGVESGIARVDEQGLTGERQ